jgi:hypothetical protein
MNQGGHGLYLSVEEHKAGWRLGVHRLRTWRALPIAVDLGADAGGGSWADSGGE